MARPSRPFADRFWERVNKNGPAPECAPHLGPCWLWTDYLNTFGYGRIRMRIAANVWRGVLVHRWSYEDAHGQIPAGLTLDHLCRRPPCVNPAHLEPVSMRENILRGDSIYAQRARQTHCKRGHAFTTENTYVSARGHRNCRACKRDREAGRIVA